MRYYGANQDITERQLAEVELEKFKLGLERSNSAIFITDPQGVITYVNPAFEKIYGYTPEETLGQTPRILKSGVIPQEQYKNFWDTLLHGQIVAGEIVNKAKDGRLIPIEGSNNPILDENGQLVGFLGMHTDITQRKQAEQILRQSEAQLSQALQISKLAYWEYDVEKDLFQFNDQFYSIFHTTAEQEGGYQLSSAQYARSSSIPKTCPWSAARSSGHLTPPIGITAARSIIVSNTPMAASATSRSASTSTATSRARSCATTARIRISANANKLKKR